MPTVRFDAEETRTKRKRERERKRTCVYDDLVNGLVLYVNRMTGIKIWEALSFAATDRTADPTGPPPPLRTPLDRVIKRANKRLLD